MIPIKDKTTLNFLQGTHVTVSFTITTQNPLCQHNSKPTRPLTVLLLSPKNELSSQTSQH